jgi:hypothetical protein
MMLYGTSNTCDIITSPLFRLYKSCIKLFSHLSFCVVFNMISAVMEASDPTDPLPQPECPEVTAIRPMVASLFEDASSMRSETHFVEHQLIKPMIVERLADYPALRIHSPAYIIGIHLCRGGMESKIKLTRQVGPVSADDDVISLLYDPRHHVMEIVRRVEHGNWRVVLFGYTFLKKCTSSWERIDGPYECGWKSCVTDELTRIQVIGGGSIYACTSCLPVRLLESHKAQGKAPVVNLNHWRAEIPVGESSEMEKYDRFRGILVQLINTDIDNINGEYGLWGDPAKGMESRGKRSTIGGVGKLKRTLGVHDQDVRKKVLLDYGIGVIQVVDHDDLYPEYVEPLGSQSTSGTLAFLNTIKSGYSYSTFKYELDGDSISSIEPVAAMVCHQCVKPHNHVREIKKLSGMYDGYCTECFGAIMPPEAMVTPE